jgi:nicotinamide riboside transporter PnuC
MQQGTHKSHYIELLQKTSISCGIFASLFLVLMVVEYLFPNLKGVLLRWEDLDFIVAIPASIVGVAYVMTIANPNNYIGFYAGILMALLLSLQFYLIGSFDLVLLYLFVFIPFFVLSIKNWKRVQDASEDNPPAFMSVQKILLVIAIFILLIVVDYLLTTFILTENNRGILWADWPVKLSSAIMIGSSFFANLLLIWKKNETWIFWIIYNLSGIIFNIIVNNIFSIVLFVIFLIINLNAQITWFKNTKLEDRGWTSLLKV